MTKAKNSVKQGYFYKLECEAGQMEQETFFHYNYFYAI